MFALIELVHVDFGQTDYVVFEVDQIGLVRCDIGDKEMVE